MINFRLSDNEIDVKALMFYLFGNDFQEVSIEDTVKICDQKKCLSAKH